MGQRVLISTLLGLSLLLVAACDQRSPDQVVNEARAEYVLESTNMLVKEPEPEPPPVAEEEAAGEASAEAAASEEAVSAEDFEDDEGMMPVEEGPRSVNVLFDMVVRYNGVRDSLPGITLDIVHLDPFDQQKAHYLQWIETPGIRKGDARQVSFEREIPNYETGDQLTIEIRNYVPPEEQGDYREFSESAS